MGAGYIGAVLSAVLADSGASVRAVDVDEDVVRAYDAGESPVREPGLGQLIGEMVRAGRLAATTDPSVVADADVVLITVGTPLKDDGTADMAHIQAAVASIAPHVRDGQLVIVKSTVPPFTTERHVAGPLRERADVLVGFCPERLAEGNAIHECRHIPVVVGGVDGRSADAAERFWRETLGVETIRVGSAREAELVKLADNMWIDLNIALATELARLADRIDVDVLPVIAAANSLPKGQHHVNILLPSVGVGGYCLTKDPWFLDAFARAHGGSFRTAVVSRTVNDESPAYAADRLHTALRERFPELAPDEQRVAVLGLSFKNDTGDCRFTPTKPAVDALLDRGYEVVAYDPWVSEADWSMFTGVERVGSAEDALRGAHAAAFLAGHREFHELSATALGELLRPGAVVFDGRMFFPRETIDAFRRAGLGFRGVGR